MTRRIPDDVRRAIADDIRAATMSVRAIAKKHGVSIGTVAKIADEHGLTLERSNPKTAHASAQTRFDARQARERLTERLYSHAEAFLDRAVAPYTVIVGTGPATQLVTLLQPPLRDTQAAMTAAAIALDKAIVLEERDNDHGAETGKTMAGDLLGLLGAAYERILLEDAAAQQEPGRR
jgi:transposase-like protein